MRPQPNTRCGPAAHPMPATLLRRLGAMIYDVLLLAALLMIATALFLPFTRGEAVTADQFPVLQFVYRCTLVLVVIGFYGLFWTRSGQTLGMASWRLRVEREDGALLTWHDTVLRLAAATLSLLPGGLGFLWILVDHDRRAWHDRLTRTRIVVLPKRGKQG